MGNSLTLGKILGIPIRLSASWFLIAALITWSLAGSFFPQFYPGWEPLAYWSIGLVTATLFFGSVLVHELGHSVVALWEKIPVRSITLFIFGGVAQIDREPDTPGAEFRIAIAGPLTSLALAAAFLAAGAASQVVSAPLAAAASYLARINLLLAVFNMVPGFPLDGGRVLRSLLWRLNGNLTNATRWATNVGRAVAFVFIGVGVFQAMTGQLMNGLWIAFIGWYLNNAAQSSYQSVVMQEMMQGVTVRDVVPQRCPTVPADLQLDTLIRGGVLQSGDNCFFVARDGVLEGMVTLNNIRSIPRQSWQTVTASQAMTPAHALAWVTPDQDIMGLLRQMEERQVSHLPLREGSRPLGLITRDALLRLISLRKQLWT